MSKVDILRQNLESGESVLWSEEADATAYVNASNVFGVIFTALWTSMICWSFSSPNFFSHPVSWIFLLAGAWGMASSVWSILRAIFVLYAITDRRLLIIRHHPWSTEIESYHETDIDFIRKTKNRRGGG